jgi:hypothetical protein
MSSSVDTPPTILKISQTTLAERGTLAVLLSMLVSSEGMVDWLMNGHGAMFEWDVSQHLRLVLRGEANSMAECFGGEPFDRAILASREIGVRTL